MKKFESNVLFNLASHIHRAKLTAPTSIYVKDLNLNTIIGPSISPVYYNNPGFTVLDLESASGKFNLKEITYHFFDLSFYTLFQGEKWIQTDVSKEFGVDLNSADSIR